MDELSVDDGEMDPSEEALSRDQVAEHGAELVKGNSSPALSGMFFLAGEELRRAVPKGTEEAADMGSGVCKVRL